MTIDTKSLHEAIDKIEYELQASYNNAKPVCCGHGHGECCGNPEYRNGIGKPVVAKRWDDVAQAYRWDVVFPPCNNFGCWPVVPEARLVGKAQDWCFRANDNLRRAALSGESTS